MRTLYIKDALWNEEMKKYIVAYSHTDNGKIEHSVKYTDNLLKLELIGKMNGFKIV